MSRPDLLRLSPEALAQAANLGLVKRAQRELDGGSGPVLELDAAGTLTATFGDGIVTVWEAEKAIQQARCTCGAAGVCRHRIMAALAYREEDSSETPALASPAEADDALLERLIPARARKAAQALEAAGLEVEIRHAEDGEPCPTARLPMATVRFWAGPAIEAARCDCVAASCCEHVLLGVWAFREAVRSEADGKAGRVRLGATSAATEFDLTPYHRLIESLARHGVTRGLAPHRQVLAVALEASEQSGAVWLGFLLRDLETWMGTYAGRGAGYDRVDGFRLVAELSLRLAAGRQPGRAKSALGIGEAAEAEMDQLRLVSLGARLDDEADSRRIRLILADHDTATCFVLTHQWQAPEGTTDDAAQLAAQRLAPGVKLLPLAGGQLLSRQAKRRADGSLSLAKARTAQNSLLPQSADWSALGRPVRFERLADLREDHALHPIPQVLPRHAAGRFAVLRLVDVGTLFYDPNAQTLIGVAADSDGESVVLKRAHRGRVRHALDAMAGVLTGQFGALTDVAGLVNWGRGHAWIEPWAFACGRIIVPDFEPACGALAAVPVGRAETVESGGLEELLTAVETELANLLHQGIAEAGNGWCDRCEILGKRLKALSLDVLGAEMAGLLGQVRQIRAAPDSGDSGAIAADLLRIAGLTALHREAMTGG